MSNEPTPNREQLQAHDQADSRQEKGWLDRLAWLPIPMFLAAFAILLLLHPPQTFDPPYLLLVLNSIFLTGTSLLVAYLASRTYRARGAGSLLLMGCGMLSLGLGSLLSGAIKPMGDLNATVAIHNIGALLGGLSCLSSALVGFTGDSGRRPALETRLRLGVAYVGVVGALTVVAALGLADLLPGFVIPGQGRTLLGWLVMGTAIASFGCSALLFGVLHRRSASMFAYWYALALGLIAVGLLGVLARSSTGTVLGWVGRAGQWLGGVYMFIASLAAIRESRAWEIPIERALRESEEQFRLMVEAVQDYAIFMLDPEGRVARWNRGAERVKGYSSQEILGQHFSRFYSPEDLAQGKPAQALAIARQWGQFAEQGWRVQKDGSRIWADVVITAMRDEAGEVRGFLKITRDITERKQAEVALASVARFPEENPQPVLRLGSDGQVHYVNAAGLGLLGDHGWRRGVPAPVVLRRQVDTVLGAGQAGEFDLPSQSGRVFSFFCVPVPDKGYANLYGRDVTEIRRAEETLLQKEAELSEAQRLAHIGSWYWDAKTDATTGSDELLRIYGLDPAIQRMPAFREQQGWLYPAEDWERVNAAVQEALRTGVGYELDVEAFRDGATIWITTRSEVVRDGDGQILGLRGTVQDITDRKRAEAALRESEHLLQDVIDGSPSAIFIKDLCGRFIKINNPLERMLGLAQESIIGKTDYEILTNARADYYRTNDRKVIETGEAIQVEEVADLVDGQHVFLASKFPLYDSRGRICAVCAISHDITDRKRTEEALRQSEERYRSLFNTLIEGFCIIEVLFDADDRPTDYRFLEINPAFETQTGLHDAQGKRMRELAPEHEAHWFEIYGKVALTGESTRFVNEAKALNRWYDVSAYRLGGRDSRKVAILFNDITEIKRAEWALFESNQRWQALMTAVPVGVSFSDDPTCRRITGNPTVLAQFEVAPPDNLSPSASNLDAPGRQVRFFQDGRPVSDAELPLQRAVSENGVIAPMELEVLLPSGRRWFAEASGAPVRDAQGNVIGGIAVTMDITERKRAEEALRVNEQRLRALGDNLPGGAIYQHVQEPDGSVRYAYMSAGIEKVLGMRADRLMADADAFRRLVLEEDRPRLASAEERSAREMSPFECEFRQRTVTGEIKWVHCRSTPHRLENGAIQWDGVVSDVTERKRAEEALRESRAMLETAMASMTDAVFISDGQGRFIEFNDAFATFHRFRNKDECARTFAEYPEILEVFMADGAPAPLDMWAVPRALRGETVTNAEYTLRRKDSGETWVGSYSFGPIRDRDGVIVGSVVAGRDITERKRVEVALRRLNEELEQSVHRLHEANRELKVRTQENEAFVYSVSHDLRSPLVNLQGFSEELSRAMQSLRADLVESDLPQPFRDRELGIVDGPMAKAIHFIQAASTRLGSIIDALLRLSRAGRVDYQRQCVDVHAIVTRIIDSLRGTVEERGATIQTGELPAALGDPAALEQIFANLIGNALNYLDCKRPGRIEVGSLGPERSNSAPGLRIYYVRDNGLGISEAGRAKVFQPFQRLYPQAAPGEGMGLAIVHRVVERHDGRIWFESVANQGSTFFVALPAFPDEAASAVPIPSARSETGNQPA